MRRDLPRALFMTPCGLVSSLEMTAPPAGIWHLAFQLRGVWGLGRANGCSRDSIHPAVKQNSSQAGGLGGVCLPQGYMLPCLSFLEYALRHFVRGRCASSDGQAVIAGLVPPAIIPPVVIVIPVGRVDLCQAEVGVITSRNLHVAREVAVVQAIVIYHRVNAVLDEMDIDVLVSHAPGDMVGYVVPWGVAIVVYPYARARVVTAVNSISL